MFARLTARNKMMDLLARRDHSEKELRQKLRKSKYEAEQIDQAIAYGKAQGWIPDTDTTRSLLAEKMANALHRKKKGILYINSYLAQKGLPEVQFDANLELEKAQNLIEYKYKIAARLTREEKNKLKAKMGRFLISRGFDSSTVRKVIYEKLRNS